jgi:branched-chain amino acid transport system permease protein
MLPQLLISGLAQGALYALVALAMTVIFRATTVINFGHGDFVMIGAFVVYVLVVLLGAPFIVSAVVAIALLFCFGWAVYSGLIRPIVKGPHLTLAMMAVAVGYALRGAARLLWGRETLPFPTVLPQDIFQVGPAIVSAGDIIVTGTVVATVAILAFGFFATPLGKIAQAVFQSDRGAALVGINVASFQGLMWGMGAGMAAIGGILIAPVTLLYPDLAVSTLIRGFAAMTLGGFGSFVGAAVGGLLLGVSELLIGGYVSSRLIDITAYLTIIAVLLVRPSGLFGSKISMRV